MLAMSYKIEMKAGADNNTTSANLNFTSTSMHEVYGNVQRVNTVINDIRDFTEGESYRLGTLIIVFGIQAPAARLAVFSPGIEENGDAGTCVVDGYAASVYWEFGNQSIYVDGKMPANSGYLWMTDKGVIGARLYIAYDFKECLTDQATILTWCNEDEIFVFGI